MPGWCNADAYTNTNTDNADANADNTDANAGDTDTNAYAGITYADTIGDPASANAKAAAHAVPSADAVRMVKD